MNEEKSKAVLRAIRKHATNEASLSVNELRVIVALERAIARLQHDPILADHLVFKGGFVLLKHFESPRFTRDVDALAIHIAKSRLPELMQNALEADLNDGLWFGNVQLEEMTDQGEYGAYRFTCAFQIGEPDRKNLHKLSRIHIDIGLSDAMHADPTTQTMPSILTDAEPVTWRIYPIEQIVAEKLQTLCDRGSANSRAKDVYDLVHLLPRCHDHNALRRAIAQTFTDRKTPLPTSLAAHAQEFDLTVLTAAWPGVRLRDDKRGFGAVWAEFLGVAEEVF